MTWILGDRTKTGAPDRSLHSGVLADHVFNNLDQSYTHSIYDLHAYHHESYDHGQTLDTADEWEWLSSISPIAVPLRRQRGGGWRKYLIELEGKATSGTVTVRAYLLREVVYPAFVDSFLSAETAYADLVFSTSSFVADSGEVTIRRWSEIRGFDAGPAGVRRRLDLPICWLVFAAKGSVNFAYATVRGPRVREVLS